MSTGPRRLTRLDCLLCRDLRLQFGTPGGGNTTRGCSAWSATCNAAKGMGQPVGQRIWHQFELDAA